MCNDFVMLLLLLSCCWDDDRIVAKSKWDGLEEDDLFDVYGCFALDGLASFDDMRRDILRINFRSDTDI